MTKWGLILRRFTEIFIPQSEGRPLRLSALTDQSLVGLCKCRSGGGSQTLAVGLFGSGLYLI